MSDLTIGDAIAITTTAKQAVAVIKKARAECAPFSCQSIVVYGGDRLRLQQESGPAK
jgi:hypothetical protein